jgi:hypothetical protein
MKQVTTLLGTIQTRTTAGNPRSNGLVENHNRTLKDMLAQYVNAYQCDWDKYLPLCAYQYNTTVNSQTGFTPFSMLYGREARQLCDQWIHTYAERFKTNENLQITPFKYISKLIQVLSHTWTLAGNRKPSEVARFNKVPTQKLPFIEYEIGEKFFRSVQPEAKYRHFTQTGITTKSRENNEKIDDDDRGKKGKTGERLISKNFQIKWAGPHTVTKKFSPVLYETIINGKPERIHAINMQKDPMINALAPFLRKQNSPITQLRPSRTHEYYLDSTDKLDEILEEHPKEVREIEENDLDYEEPKYWLEINQPDKPDTPITGTEN